MPRQPAFEHGAGGRDIPSEIVGILKRIVRFVLVLALVLVPDEALANGFLPAVNAFRPTPVFYLSFWAVVLLESLCFRVWLKRVHLGSVLWRVVLFNAVSSLAGYLLMRSNLRPEYTKVWQQAIPFFFLTLAVEWPLTRLLFQRALFSWRRALFPIITANLISYAMLIAVEDPIEAVWHRYLWALNQHALARWTDFRMLSEGAGRIYGTESGPGLPHSLRYFSFSDCRWHSMSNCPAIDPRNWDVAGNLFAYISYPWTRSETVKLTSLPDFSPLQEIPIARPPFAKQGAWTLKISPDRTKLAVLIWQYEIVSGLSGSSYRVLGAASELAVFDTASGRSLGTCPRQATGSELCWLSDSKSVLFRSLRDERLHGLPVKQEGRGVPQAVSEPTPAFDDRPVYVYDVQTGRVRLFGVMKSPHLALDAGLLAWQSGEDAISLHSLDTGTNSTIQVGRFGRIGLDIEISPDARFVIAPLTVDGLYGYATVVDLRDPSRKHFLGWDYRYAWRSEKAVRQT